ncbi:unnamed protein product, partial [Owenia fusiformis]
VVDLLKRLNTSHAAFHHHQRVTGNLGETTHHMGRVLKKDYRQRLNAINRVFQHAIELGNAAVQYLDIVVQGIVLDLRKSIKQSHAVCLHVTARAEGSDTEPYYVGEVIRFVCNIGYPIVGKDSIKCLSNGQWDGPVPTCNPVCYWKQWGSWINGDCVASGLPLTPQCYRPGTSLCYRTRRCYCVGRGYSRSTYCTGSSKEYETKTCCLPYLPPPPSCRWEPWGPWKNHGRCEKNGLPGTPNCAYPGTLRCYRTRECNCRRKRHGGTAYCHGPSKEYENKPCCYKHTYTPPHYPPPGYPPILHPMK